MRASSVTAFTKTDACPSSSLLLSFRLNVLSPEIMTLIRNHLAVCDFCYAEIPLLAHYEKPVKGECKAPEIPINLRILAESLLGKNNKIRSASDAKGGTFGLSLADP